MRNIRTFPQLLFRILVRPDFPLIQWFGRVTGMVTKAKMLEGPNQRQPFLIGYLKDGMRAEDIEAHLKSQGFFRHRVAYADPGQLISMRRLDDTYPDHQYHLRTFVDGEVRGHYELTPEDHPFDHLNEVVRDPKTDDFKKFTAGILR